MTAPIRVERAGGPDPLEFEVCLGDGPGAARHHVTAERAHIERLAGGSPPERVIEAAFLFLLDREPAGAIMARFELPVISRYFPDFEDRLPGYIAQVLRGG